MTASDAPFHLSPATGMTMTFADGTRHDLGSVVLFAFPREEPPPAGPTPVRLDPEGKPYGWSFTCAECDLVYVREENPHPSHDHAMAVMSDHADEHHPGWRER